MAAYPTLPTMIGSLPEPVESRVLARATNGAVKVRRLHPTEKVTLNLKHEISAADKATLDAHYSAHVDSSFSYTWPGTGGGTYTVVYGARPIHEEQPGGWFLTKVVLEEA